MSMKKSHWFVVLWVAGAAVALFLYYRWQVEAELVGIVETRVHRVGAGEGGRVGDVLVEIGDEVDAGTKLATLDRSDLEAEKARLREELASLGRIMEADRKRFSMEFDRSRLQLEYRSAWLQEKNADTAARKAELAAVDAEIRRLRGAEKDGLGRTRELADLEIRRNALARYLGSMSLPTRAVAKEPQAPREADQEQVIESLTADRMDRVEEIRLELVRIEQRMRAREVVSPVDGFVVDVLARRGDTLPAFAPIVAVEETRASAVDVYLPETREAPAVVGQLVEVVSKRGDEFNAKGRVTFIYPGYMPIPERLMFRRQMAWALKLRVGLEPGHRLRPGESVKVRVLDGTAEAAGKLEPPVDGPLAMKVPATLLARTRFEPSGVVWLADIGRYLVVSDDTGLKGSDDHAPWVFLMTGDGEVEPEPLVIEGIESINDLEAVTVADDGTLYLVTSHSVNRKGKRPGARRLLVRVHREGRKLVARGSVSLLPGIERALGAKGVADLDIEALAWKGDALYFGLKQPTAPGGAMILKLDGVDALFTGAALRIAAPGEFATVDLGTHQGRRAGFSDLLLEGGSRAFALATVPDAGARGQQGFFVELSAGEGGGWSARVLRAFPGLKPEGLCRAPDGGFMVVFDAGAGTPLYIHLEKP